MSAGGRSLAHGIRRKQDPGSTRLCGGARRRRCARRPFFADGRPCRSRRSSRALLQQLNAVRADHGLPALRSNAKLAAAADTAFARDGRRRVLRPRLVRRDVVLDADRAAGTRSRAIGAGRSARTCSGRRRASIPPGAVAMWMRSPAHRANILNPRWREIGIGAVTAPRPRGAFTHLPVTIITTDFGVRR